ncbi:hypothetical protein P280DRAFT_203849 [Massarina eburnea CBS 473.64]|uniref:Uncharacterized protein n=1 Tax=Massarina eburnea CBS 473.64 TaxID=1395130 RepID=A0A6A6RID6_9PLEO|nr:hypothetical protein P280DRAFT_203849 [Massarina eburnea CBS 473.64]
MLEGELPQPNAGWWPTFYPFCQSHRVREAWISGPSACARICRCTSKEEGRRRHSHNGQVCGGGGPTRQCGSPNLELAPPTAERVEGTKGFAVILLLLLQQSRTRAASMEGLLLPVCYGQGRLSNISSDETMARSCFSRPWRPADYRKKKKKPDIGDSRPGVAQLFERLGRSKAPTSLAGKHTPTPFGAMARTVPFRPLSARGGPALLAHVAACYRVPGCGTGAAPQLVGRRRPSSSLISHPGPLSGIPQVALEGGHRGDGLASGKGSTAHGDS